MARARGARPTPRHKLAAATPHKIRGTTPPQFAVIPDNLSMWLNDVDGDCVTAEEAFAKACYSPEIFIQDATVKAWATAHNVLNGAELLEVLQWMQAAGFSQDGGLYNDGAATTVDWTDAAVLTNAISLGPVKIGVAADQLENVVGNSNGWFAAGFKADSNEDHCVSLCGYGSLSWLAQQLSVSLPAGVDGTQPGYLLFTWSTVGIIDVPSMLAITAEAWLRSPTTVVIGPAPAPGPTPPTPTPVPSLQQQIDAVFAALEAAYAKYHAVARMLKWVQALVDQYLFQHPEMTGGLSADPLRVVIDDILSTLEQQYAGDWLLVLAFQTVQGLLDPYI